MRLVIGGRRGGKTALQWHLLRQESTAVDRPIVCALCLRPYSGRPPPLGRCPCGSYAFGILAADEAQPQLPLEGAHG